jgi:hypothetical protein
MFNLAGFSGLVKGQNANARACARRTCIGLHIFSSASDFLVGFSVWLLMFRWHVWAGCRSGCPFVRECLLDGTRGGGNSRCWVPRSIKDSCDRNCNYTLLLKDRLHASIARAARGVDTGIGINRGFRFCVKGFSLVRKKFEALFWLDGSGERGKPRVCAQPRDNGFYGLVFFRCYRSGRGGSLKDCCTTKRRSSF